MSLLDPTPAENNIQNFRDSSPQQSSPSTTTSAPSFLPIASRPLPLKCDMTTEYYYRVLTEFHAHFDYEDSALVWLATAKVSRWIHVPIEARYPQSVKGEGGYATAFRTIGLFLRENEIRSSHYHNWICERSYCNLTALQKALRKRVREIWQPQSTYQTSTTQSTRQQYAILQRENIHPNFNPRMQLPPPPPPPPRGQIPVSRKLNVPFELVYSCGDANGGGGGSSGRDQRVTLPLSPISTAMGHEESPTGGGITTAPIAPKLDHLSRLALSSRQSSSNSSFGLSTASMATGGGGSPKGAHQFASEVLVQIHQRTKHPEKRARRPSRKKLESLEYTSSMRLERLHKTSSGTQSDSEENEIAVKMGGFDLNSPQQRGLPPPPPPPPPPPQQHQHHQIQAHQLQGRQIQGHKRQCGQLPVSLSLPPPVSTPPTKFMSSPPCSSSLGLVSLNRRILRPCNSDFSLGGQQEDNISSSANRTANRSTKNVSGHGIRMLNFQRSKTL